MFPNRGFNTQPIFISRIEDKNGNVLQSFESESKQVISEVDGTVTVKRSDGKRAALRLGDAERFQVYRPAELDAELPAPSDGDPGSRTYRRP